MDGELARLQRDLDRFDRRTRLFGAAGLAAAVFVIVLGIGARQAQSQQDSLSGRALVLVDDAGRQRIVLGSDTGNRPGIWLRDESGKAVVRSLERVHAEILDQAESRGAAAQAV